MNSVLLILPFVTWLSVGSATDKPCAARATSNNSILCVCTADYCDSCSREIPPCGMYYTYVSSEDGLRFNKNLNYLQNFGYDAAATCSLELDPDTRYQTINGFGGAVTDSAGINWKSLSDPQLMQNLIDSYCSDSGNHYNMLRVPVGGTDFSPRPYTYADYPIGDASLSNFALAYEDYEYKIPMIQACMAASGAADIDIVGACWSPPVWMKSNFKISGRNILLKKYFRSFANYIIRFLEEYKKEGIHFWGMSTTNEPLNGLLNFTTINDLGWTIPDMAEWITDHMGPTLRNSSFKDIKILAGDDQRFAIFIYWNMLTQLYPDTLKYLDGCAVHFYFDYLVPASSLTAAMKDNPDKFLISTEGCTGVFSDVKVDLGSWSRAEEYIVDIIEDLNHNVIGWIDWNMCLDSEGGPGWTGGRVDSPVIVNPEAGEFYKQPMFYAMGHFSKFAARGSQRIKSTVCGCDNDSSVIHVSLYTPSNTVVVVLYNKGRREEIINIRVGRSVATAVVGKKSIVTVELPVCH